MSEAPWSALGCPAGGDAGSDRRDDATPLSQPQWDVAAEEKNVPLIQETGEQKFFIQDVCFFCLKPAVLENEATSLKIRALLGKIKCVSLRSLAAFN